MKTIAVCFGNYGPYHVARIDAFQHLAKKYNYNVLPIQIASKTKTYKWERLSPVNIDFKLNKNEFHDMITLFDSFEEDIPARRLFFEARKIFIKNNVRIAFLPSYWPLRNLALLCAAKSLGLKTVMMNESHFGTEKANKITRLIKKLIILQFDAALVGGRPQLKHFKKYGFPEQKIFDGYDAIDNRYFEEVANKIRTQDFKFSETGLEAIDDKENNGEKLYKLKDLYELPDKYFLSLGRMVEKKNLHTLITAYAKFIHECATLESNDCIPELVIVGDGQLMDELIKHIKAMNLAIEDKRDIRLEKLIQDKNLVKLNSNKKNKFNTKRGRVFLYGFRQIYENVIFYANAEIFILPSTIEEWGLVVNEAMASCLPVAVSSKAGCSSDLLPIKKSDRNHGQELSTENNSYFIYKDYSKTLEAVCSFESRYSGYIFNPYSPNALAAVMINYSSLSEDEKKEMGKRSNEVIQMFGCDYFARQAMLAVKACMI